jgi:hypothetical protein
MIVSSRNLLLSGFSFCTVAAIVIACGSAKNSNFDDGKLKPGSFGDGGFGEAGQGGGPDLYANDPPPTFCGPDSGITPPVIKGTLDCPEDKNKPGCGCDKIGDTAPCWTGLRKNRSLGVCKDGVATCNFRDENANVWGPCVGEVLPLGPTGTEACSCFSVGEWDLANTSPCLRQVGTHYYAYSTVLDPVTGKNTFCGEGGAATIMPEGQAPAGIWSTDSLTVDCAGNFNLVFRIRQGDFNNPSANDCVLGESTTVADYKQAGVSQKLPDLPTWAGKDADCANRWENPDITPSNKSPGYGEMIVKGVTRSCETVDQGGAEFVFHRVKFCARMCRNGQNPTDPECQSCQLAGQGQFK